VRSRAGTHTLTRGALRARAAWAAVQDRRRLRPRPGLPPLRALGLLLRGAGAGSRHGGRRRGLNGHVSPTPSNRVCSAAYVRSLVYTSVRCCRPHRVTTCI
jgi:hypothetical protein